MTDDPERDGVPYPMVRALFDATGDAIIVTDLQFGIRQLNRAAVALYGWRLDEVMGRSVGEAIPTTYLGDTPESVVEAFWQTGVWSGEVIQQTRSGQRVFVNTKVNVVRDDHGEAVAVVAINRDITEARRARATQGLVQDLARVMATAPAGRTRGRAIEVLCAAIGSQGGFVGVVDHADDLVCSSHDRRTYVWPRTTWWSTLPDHTATIDLGRLPSGAVPAPVAELGPSIAVPIGGQAGRIGHVVLARPDGERDPPHDHTLELLGQAAAQLAPILRAQQQRDRQMRERAVLTDRMRQSQRLEAIGRLAGGIAHDFSNLLTIIANHTDLGLVQADRDAVSRPHLEAIGRAADRAMSLTTQLVAFNRKPLSSRGAVDLSAAVRELEPLLQRLIGEDVVVEAHIPCEPVWVRIQRGAIDQILLNLVANARDAMPDGGRLTLRLDRAPPPAHARVRTPIVRLTVADTGRGMTNEVASRVFEPFYTTKGPARGTGLGLFTVYGIVTRHRGHIELSTEPGRGASFELWLSVEEGEVDVEVPAPMPPRPVVKEARILLVEDEDDLRAVVGLALRDAGYEVVDVGGRTEAVARHGEPFDLIVSDVVMPDGSGPAIVARFQAEQPSIRALFMSGHPGDAIERHGLDPSTRRIDKPFRIDDLLRAIEEVLHAP
ncbi:MAG: ATP-binding protein [Myxococcota bacterium]